MLQNVSWSGLDGAGRVLALTCLGFVVTGLSVQSVRAGVVFIDTFDRADTTVVGNDWAEVNALPSTGSTDGDALITSGALLMTNDATTAANARGRTYLLQNGSSLSGGYSPTLGSSSGTLSWAFNTRLVYSVNGSGTENDLTGFNYVAGGNYGIAFVLAAAPKPTGSPANILNSGSSDNSGFGYGYAIVIGSSSTDAVRLVRFSDGLRGTGTSNTSITEITRSTVEQPLNYLSIRVTFNPVTGEWSLFEAASESDFLDPTLASSQVGTTVVDTTYTNEPLPYFGPLWNYANGSSSTSGGSRVLFDNISLSVQAIPEPSAGLALVMTLPLALRRRR